MTFDNLIARLAEQASLPFAQAAMLPVEAYTSEQLLALEIDRLFASEWLCVGRSADIAEVGDHLTALLPSPSGNRSVIIVRDDDGRIRALDNVCIHRGAELISNDAQTCTAARFTCPYHAWTYRLDGTLVSAPYMAETTEADGTPFDPDHHRLGELAVETWEGFVFVSQVVNPAPLAHQLSGLHDVVGRYAMNGYVPVYDSIDVWQTNWKLLVENFMDAYHIFKVHKLSFGASGDDTAFTTMHPGTDRWAHHRVMNPNDDDLCHESNATLEGDWRKTTILAAIFPGFVIQLQPDWLWFLRVTPLSTSKVRIAWQVAIAPELLAAQSNRDAYVGKVMDLVHQVNSEDHPIVEGIRRSVTRPQFERGPFSYLERNVYDFDRYIASSLGR